MVLLAIDRKDTLSNKSSLVREIVRVFAGACLIAGAAQIQVPLYPVPITFQTAAVSFLLMSNPMRAFYSCVFYLLLATLGLPVLYGGESQALWLFRPTLGYLIAMPLSCLIASIYIKAESTWSQRLIILSLVHFVTLLMGAMTLSLHVGFYKAFWSGFAPFLITEPIKIFTVLGLLPIIRR